MAIVKCPECGSEVSDKARACPKCGYPLAGEQEGSSSDSGSGQESAATKTKPKKKHHGCLIAILVAVAVIVILVGACTAYWATRPKDSPMTTSSSQTAAQQGGRFELIGAYWPSTGNYDPKDRLVPLGADRSLTGAAKKKMLVENEKSDKEKTLFVAAELYANLDKDTSVGDDGVLNINGTDDLYDAYEINENDESVNGKPLDMGYHTANNASTLRAGAKKPYKVMFMFFVKEKDMKQSKTAHLTWNGCSLDFKLSQVKKVGTPSDMVKDLRG